MNFKYLEDVAKRAIILDEHGRIHFSPTILFEKRGIVQMVSMHAPLKTLRVIFKAIKKKIKPKNMAVICLVDYRNNTYLLIEKYKMVRANGRRIWKKKSKVYAIIQLEDGFDLDEVKMGHKIALNID